MQIYLSSGGCDIIASGQTFLFGRQEDLRIRVEMEQGFSMEIRLNFMENESGEVRIQSRLKGDILTISCLNFENAGSGVSAPQEIAEIDGRKLYFTFWSYVDGKESRSVRYTFFYEKSPPFRGCLNGHTARKSGNNR